MLFFATERFEFYTATWDGRLRVAPALRDDAEPFMRRQQSQNRCVVDPSGRFMAMLLWEGVLNLLRLPPRKPRSDKLEMMEQVRLSELWIKAACFVPTETGHPTIALLHRGQNDADESFLTFYRVTEDDKDARAARFEEKERLFHQGIQDVSARMLIQVPIVEDEVKRYHRRNTEGARPHLGGVVVVGQSLLQYVDSLTQAMVYATMEEPRLFCAWAAYDMTRYILGDELGQLHVLTLENEGAVVTGMTVRQVAVGTTSRASALVYMGGNMLFVASHQGDSQLYRLDVDELTADLVEEMANNAPNLDFQIMDMGNRDGDPEHGNQFSSGQTRLVAACGAWENGSLRSIRSGVGLEYMGDLEADFQVGGLFSLRSAGASRTDTLIVSQLTDTRIFRVTDEVEEMDSFMGLSGEKATLLAANVGSDRVVQVTDERVVLLDAESGMAVAEWTPQSQAITEASINASWLLLLVGGTRLVCLNPTDLSATEQTLSDDQISCIHAAQTPPDVAVVGFWQSCSISLVRLPTLDAIHGETLKQTHDSSSLPRSISMAQMHPPDTSGPTLLVSMEDGNLLTFDVGHDLSLSGRKTVVLGTREGKLHVLPQPDGTNTVFAATEHSSLVYSAEGRIVFSATPAKDVQYVAPFDTPAFPGALALATWTNVQIATVDAARRTHVTKQHIGRTVRRVAYSPGLRAFGLGCIARRIHNGEELVQSTFELVDEVVFEPLGAPLSLGNHLVEAVISARLPDPNGHLADRFLVGGSDNGDGDRGRILVLGVDSHRRTYRITQRDLKAQCRALDVTPDGLIVAALEKTVIIFSHAQETSVHGTLHTLASYTPSSFPLDVRASGDRIAIMDLQQSLIIVRYVPPARGEKGRIEDVARHLPQVSGTAMCEWGGDGGGWVQADVRGNVMVLEEDGGRLRVVAEGNVGEQVCRIRRVRVGGGGGGGVRAVALMSTVRLLLFRFVVGADESRLRGRFSSWGRFNLRTWMS